MAHQHIRLIMHVSWWFKYYVRGLLLMHQLTGMGISEQRVAYWIGKAVKVKYDTSDA